MFIPLIASLARLPREGNGTATPIPRKLKKLSVKMEEGTYRAYSETGEFLMLAKVDDSVMSTVKSFFEV